MDQRMDGLEDYIGQCAESWRVPGLAVGVVDGDEIVYAGGAGCRNVEQQLPVTADSRFGVLSCGKSFTSAAVGVLVQEGIIEWDRPIRDYVPSFRMYDPVASEKATFRDLLAHRTGMPNGGHDWLTLNSPLSRNQLLARLPYLEPSGPFQGGFQYSNLMYIAAGALIEEITGRTWEEIVQQHILLPLGMLNSGYSCDEADERAMINYLWENDVLIRASSQSEPGEDVMQPSEHYLGRPCGGIVSTSEDMCRWLQCNLAPTILSDETLRELHSPQLNCSGVIQGPEVEDGGVALGWFTQKYRGRKVVLHWGSPGGPTVASFMPDEGVGVFVHSNIAVSTFHAINAVMLNVYDRLLGLEEIPWREHWQDTCSLRYLPPVPESEAKVPIGIDFDRYTGSYRHPAYGEITVARRGERLVVAYNTFTYHLEPECADCFDMILVGKVPSVLVDYWGRRKVKVNFDSGGHAQTIDIPFEPSVTDVRFERA